MKTFKEYIQGLHEEDYDRLRDKGILKTGSRAGRYRPNTEKIKSPPTIKQKHAELSKKYGKPTKEKHGPHEYDVWKSEKGKIKIKTSFNK